MGILREVIRSYRNLHRQSASDQERLALKCLLSHTSYRLTKKEASDPSIGFRVLARTLRLVLRREKNCKRHLSEGKSNTCLLTSVAGKPELNIAHINENAPNRPGVLIQREYLPEYLPGNILDRLIFFFLSVGISFRVFLRNENRGNVALHISFIAETASLISIAKSLSIDEVYEWDPYMLNSNWQYMLLARHHILVNKLPSPGPLQAHHRILFTDRLILSTPYQEEELKILNHNIEAKEVHRWPPEGATQFIDRYLSFDLEPPKKTVGFYSHASWLRKKEQHADDGLNIAHTETQILRELGEYIASETDVQLTVFTHPRERQSRHKEATISYYEENLGKGKFRFCDWDLKSSDAFESVAIGVAAYSTIIYERLYCGYPMIIGRHGTPDFPLELSSLSRVSFGRYADLKRLLDESLALDRRKFFKRFDLEPYLFKNYPNFRPTK